MTLVYEFLQYRIARFHNSLVIRTPGNGGAAAGQRAAALLSRGHARFTSGTDSRAQPCKVSSSTVFEFKMFWKRENQPPPFTVDESTALGFLGAILASVVGTIIKHSVAVTEAVEPLPQNIAAQESHHERGKSCEHSSRSQPHEAGCCTETSPIVCEANPCGGNFSSTPAAAAAAPLHGAANANSSAGMPGVAALVSAAALADADGVAHADADADAATAAPATLAPPSAGRHAATYKLECICLVRQKIDRQRKTINNLEA
eukprot:2541732-Pleurochrysis_carterae.AAC.2